MVYIISGEIGSGKTTRMLELYSKAVLGTADGLVSRKIYLGAGESSPVSLEGESRESEAGPIGYELLRLSNGESRVLVMLASHYNGEFEKSFRFDRFVFSEDGFRFGEGVIEELLEDDSISDIYIDEIGPIELKGQGFCQILHKALQTDKNLYLSVRSKCLDRVLERFGIEEGFCSHDKT